MGGAGHIARKVSRDARRVLASKDGGRTQLGRPSVTGDNIKICFKIWMKECVLHLTFSECEQVAGC